MKDSKGKSGLGHLSKALITKIKRAMEQKQALQLLGISSIKFSIQPATLNPYVIGKACLDSVRPTIIVFE